jgi:uncharacterized protein (DUF58 family)
MTAEYRTRPADNRRGSSRLSRWAVSKLWPNQRLRWTREGGGYLLVWAAMLVTGLYQQVNLILLVAGLASGPVVASIFVSARMLRKIRVTRRVPAYVFSGEPLKLDYTLENDRSWTGALALVVHDDAAPVDRTAYSATHVVTNVFFPKVAERARETIRWEGASPSRGRYVFKSIDLVTRSPFGIFERQVTLVDEDSLIVYPKIGQLTRRWHLYEREASETRRGLRHERSSQQHEYHGLRDYRPGDSPRWIHWRTSARLGQPMVKEFEQQHEQDLCVLIDPWMPRSKVEPKQREAVEEAIRFTATLCHETCRHAGRRLLLGWTGSVPGLRQGPASIKLLHELLAQLATLKPSPEGGLAPLLDVLPPAMLREALIVVISTRPINLYEEAERSVRLSETSSRGMFGRVTMLDVSRGDLNDLITFGSTDQTTGSISKSADRSEPNAADSGSSLGRVGSRDVVANRVGSEGTEPRP